MVNFKSICCTADKCYVIKINMVYILTKKKYTEVVIWWGSVGSQFSLLKAAVATWCRSQCHRFQPALDPALPVAVPHATAATNRFQPLQYKGWLLLILRLAWLRGVVHVNLSRHFVN